MVNPVHKMEGYQLEMLLQLAIKAADDAAKAVYEIYKSGNFNVKLKNDQSPLTKADKEAHRIIKDTLKKAPFPILSEEGKNTVYETRKNWENYWLIDPLDGTKEFIRKNGDFTINIALMHKNKPVLGVVKSPVYQKTYYAIKGQGTYLEEKDKTRKIQCSSPSPGGRIRIVASRVHLNEQTRSFIEQFKNPEVIIMGSSLKFMLIAEGKADIYPRMALCMEWDTAASQIILEEAGGKVLEWKNNRSLEYNKPDLANPFFIAYGY